MALSIPTTATAVTKAGAKCQKVGVKSVVGAKTFTCTKSGKKLVWDKGVNKATLIPQTREEKALELVRVAHLSRPLYKPPITYVVAEKSNQRMLELIKVSSEEAAKFFQYYYKPQSEIPLIMADGEDIEWMISNMNKYGFEMDHWARNNFKNGWGNAATNGKSTILIYTGKTSSDKKICIYCNLGFGAHEYIHVATIGILGKGSIFGEVIPRWSWEGSADFFARAVVELMPDKGELNWDKAMKRKFKTYYESSKYYNAKDRVPILHSLSSQQLYDTFISPEIDAGNCPMAYCYTAGEFLTEVLVADYGIDTFISWWRASINTPWRSAFEKTFGVNFNQWLAEVGIPYVMDGANKAYPEQPAHPDYKKKIEFTKS